MAAPYLLQLPEVSGQTRYEGANAIIVYADDVAGARVLAKAKFSSDIDAVWDGATVTDLSAPTIEGFEFTVNVGEVLSASYTADSNDTIDDVGTALALALIAAGGDLEGYVFNIVVTTAAIDVTYTGLAGDTIDDVGAALVILLNATAIDGAEYSTTTKLLTIADIADGIGDDTVVFTVTDPAEADVSATFATDIVHEGIAGAVLTSVLRAPGFITDAAYNTGTNVLTIAETTDVLGDEAVTVSAVLAGGAGNLDYEEDVSVDGFFSTIVDEGSASAALKVTLVDKKRQLFGVFQTV
jgi:hypothetical protein